MSTPGHAFAEAVAAKDAAAVSSLLSADVDFKALTPRRLWEASDLEGVLETLFEHWLTEDDHIDALVSVTEGEPVEDTGQVSYRFALSTPDGPHTVEQTAYYRTDGDRISYLRVMCSGFRPVR
jgi:hypothetical protein